MASTVAEAGAADHPKESPPERVVLYGVSWSLYERLLEETGERPIHFTYDGGTLEIMTNSREHESSKKTIGRLIELLTLELNIPICGLGSTTFRREDLAKGLEPDECYYIQHEAQMRGKGELDLPADPPPDLVVEIDISYRAVDRERICAGLGVPELWRFDGLSLVGLRLKPDGRYAPTDTSVAFPFLRIADLERFIKMSGQIDETSLMRAFRDWVRAELVP